MKGLGLVGVRFRGRGSCLFIIGVLFNDWMVFSMPVEDLFHFGE